MASLEAAKRKDLRKGIADDYMDAQDTISKNDVLMNGAIQQLVSEKIPLLISKYIVQLIRQFGGDVSKALMAYNCGPGNVKKGCVPASARQYAQKVFGTYRRLKQ